MKCTFCGKENLVKTSFPMDSYGDGGSSVSKDVDVYLCLDCGHFEFFSTSKANKYYEDASLIRNTETEIKNLYRELEELQNPLTIQKINDEIKMVEKQLKSLDITIRQQQKLKNTLSELKRNLGSIPQKIDRIKGKIRQLESDLKTKKLYFENDYKKV